MKVTAKIFDKLLGDQQSSAGFTLIEAMLASSIMVLVIAALLSAHIMGLRQNELLESKAGASDTSRRVLNQLPVDIRSSKMWFVGNMSGTNFVANTNITAGTAIQLCTTTNGSSYILYYFDLSNSNNSDGHLLRYISASGSTVLLASNLVNWLGGGYSFRIEDYNGTPAVDTGTPGRSYKSVIHTTLQFCQFQYPLTAVGTNALYDYYKIEFKATPHLPE